MKKVILVLTIVGIAALITNANDITPTFFNRESKIKTDTVAMIGIDYSSNCIYLKSENDVKNYSFNKYKKLSNRNGSTIETLSTDGKDSVKIKIESKPDKNSTIAIENLKTGVLTEYKLN